jgi:hypothetical protein
MNRGKEGKLGNHHRLRLLIRKFGKSLGRPGVKVVCQRSSMLLKSRTALIALPAGHKGSIIFGSNEMMDFRVQHLRMPIVKDLRGTFS